MTFTDHSRIKGKHSFLSASKYSWIRYDEDKLIDTFQNAVAAQRGTELHEFAAQAIKLRIPLDGTDTLAQYVNDAIGFRMDPEVVLFYSDNCFGTADAISYRNNKLRIHDLKTGVSKASMDQLLVYSAMFCLEYGRKPSEMEIILRIYQQEEVVELNPGMDDILPIMEQIVYFDPIIDRMKEELAGVR